MEYIYLIRTVGFVKDNKEIYKIGRTREKNPHKRLRHYDRDYELKLCINVDNCVELEKKIITKFKEKFIQHREDNFEKSQEFFQGDLEEMKRIITGICVPQNKETNEKKENNSVGGIWSLLGY